MTTQLVFARNGQALTTSEIIAQGVEVQHKNILALLRTYQSDFETFGILAFETQKSPDAFETRRGCIKEKVVAILSEQQATLLVTYCKNTETVRKFKVALVKAFYEMKQQLQPSIECPIATLTPAQQLQLREAVAKRAQTATAHYHTIYRALYARFQVPRYTEILAKDFDAAIDFIRSVDLRVPMCTPAKKEASQACPMCGLRPVPQGSVILHPDECRALATFIYYVRYLFRGCLLKFADTLIAFNAPEAGRFYEAVTASTYVTIERTLARRGYTVSQNGISLPQPQKQHKQITC